MIKIELDENNGIWEPKSFEEVDNMEYAHRLYREKVVRVGERYARAMGEIEPPYEDDCEIDSYGSDIEISWTEYDRCGDWNGGSITFPKKYLWLEEDWEEELKQERLKKQMEALRKKEEEKKANALKKRARDYKTYLALKKKFEEKENG